jgi:hypothetical protein
LAISMNPKKKKADAKKKEGECCSAGKCGWSTS